MTTAYDYSNTVTQAIGMVSVQAGCTTDEALERLEDRSRSTGRTVERIGQDVIDRKIRFAP